MAQLVPIRLEDGTEIYIEATENVTAPAPTTATGDSEESLPMAQTRTAKGFFPGSARDAAQAQAMQSFKAIESTIRSYTNYTLGAFKGMASAKVDKVTLEFGLTVGGEAGVPYVTKGVAESNLRITVECSFTD